MCVNLVKARWNIKIHLEDLYMNKLMGGESCEGSFWMFLVLDMKNPPLKDEGT